MIRNFKDIIFPIITGALFIFLFFGLHQISYVIAFFALISLFISIKNKRLNYRYNKSLFLILFFYIIHVVGVLYSTNKDIAAFDVEIKLSLFIFPLLMLFVADLIVKNYNNILRLFFIIISLFSLSLLVNAIINFINTKNINDVIYTNFSVLLHPSYFAMYLIFAMIVSFYAYKKVICKSIIIPIISIFINIMALLFSDSKSGYVGAILVFLYLLISLLYKKSKLYTVISVFILLILGVVLVKTNQRLQIMLNVTENYNKIINNPNTYKESTGLRILSWNATIDAIKENPIFGVGTGDIKPVLLKKYEDLNYQKNIEIKMNVHNQFLETWLGQGVVGFILLLLVFIIPFIEAIKRKNIILQAFLLLVFINFLFESMLNTQAGTIFFGFFYSFLVVVNNED